MAQVIKQHGTSGHESGSRSRDPQSCEYEAYVPDTLRERSFALDGPVAAAVAEAETAITRLNLGARTASNSEALARLLLRTDVVASARIDGLEVGARRLLRAETARAVGKMVLDVKASEILGSCEAMVFALSSVADGEPITPGRLMETHRRLRAGSHLEGQGGRTRDERSWIGGSRLDSGGVAVDPPGVAVDPPGVAVDPPGAVLVPPPCEMVGDYLADLCEFCNDDSLPALAQAAIAHAQFETVQPFIEANGRMGTALIHMVLRRRGLVPTLPVPVAPVLAAWSADYAAALAATRYVGSPASAEAHEGLNWWVALFAAATRKAVADATALEERIARLEADWRTYLGRVRKDSATDLLLSALPAAPVLTVQGAASLIGRSVQAANQAVARLEEAAVLRRVTVGGRNRAFQAPELIRALADLERSAAGPAGGGRPVADLFASG